MKPSKLAESAEPKRLPPNAGKGRPPGIPNKLTREAKEAIALAFEGIGGLEALTEWAKEHPEAFYTKVWVRLIPHTVIVPQENDPTALSDADLADLAVGRGVRAAVAPGRASKPH